MFGIATLTFFLMHLVPGNPLQGEKTNPAQLAALTHSYGLDRPLYEQYWDFLLGATHLDFGNSYHYTNLNVTKMIWDGFTVTAELAMTAFVIMLVVGIGFGTLAGIKQNTWIDYTLTGISILVYSVPSFIMGLGFLMLSVFFHNTLHWEWWPTGGWGDITKGEQPEPLQLLIPAFGYGIRSASIITRLTRAQIVETKSQDYVRTAQSKGITGTRVTTRHVLRNALLPVASVVGDSFGGLLIGTIIWEAIFQVPGIGGTLVDSILNVDYSVILGTTVFIAFMVAIVNLGVDLIYAVLDPRIKYTTRSVA
jgi:ABC-type dipeptide/oligopeptide/nickel transport system permease component